MNRVAVSLNSQMAYTMVHQAEVLGMPRPLCPEGGMTVQPDEEYTSVVGLPSQQRFQEASAACCSHIWTSLNNNVRQHVAIARLGWSVFMRDLWAVNEKGGVCKYNHNTFSRSDCLQDVRGCSIGWSHDGKVALLGCADGTVRMEGEVEHRPPMPLFRDKLTDVSFAPTDEKFCASCADKSVYVVDPERVKVEHKFADHRWDVNSAEWHPNSSLIVSGSRDNIVRLMDARSQKMLASFEGHNGPVHRVRWSKNGNWFVSVSEDHNVILYDIRTMKEMHNFTGHTGRVTTAAWHPFCESVFCTGGGDSTIRYWSVENMECLGVIHGAHEQAEVRDVAWHPYGHIVASCSKDKAVKFWGRNAPGQRPIVPGKVSNLKEIHEPVYEDVSYGTAQGASKDTLEVLNSMSPFPGFS